MKVCIFYVSGKLRSIRGTAVTPVRSVYQEPRGCPRGVANLTGNGEISAENNGLFHKSL